MTALLRRLAAANSGVALTEFALSLPLMILIYLGGYQLCDAISAYRKMTTTTRAIADITSQYTSVTNTDLDTVLAASQQVMSPYPASEGKFTITQVKIDDKGVATVDWSRGKNISGLVAGTPFTIPDSIRQPNTSLLVAETLYTYKGSALGSFIGDIPMKDRIIVMPRATGSIKWKAG
jgi:Flp pilus assembly protein TadG